MKNLNLLAAALTIALAGNAAAGPKAELPKELPPGTPKKRTGVGEGCVVFMQPIYVRGRRFARW